jgi:hypothetical protein
VNRQGRRRAVRRRLYLEGEAGVNGSAPATHISGELVRAGAGVTNSWRGHAQIRNAAIHTGAGAHHRSRSGIDISHGHMMI